MEDEAGSRGVVEFKENVGGGRPAELEPGEASYNPTRSNVHKALGISREVILQAFLGSRSFSQERLPNIHYFMVCTNQVKSKEEQQ